MMVEKCYKKIYKELVDECGQPITVRDYETWEDVRAYGTYQFGNEDDMLWTYDGKLYRLCFRELSQEAQEIILENKKSSIW
jgi:hypothetical protein|nr:MAG TPA: hypothetical protein [Caudoviricetes sp.]